MPLPNDFHFNQNNIQDFLDCPKRFQLLHIEKVAWPALISEPALETEKLITLGSRFHLMVQQYFLGMDEKEIETLAEEPILEKWLKGILTAFPKPFSGEIYAELSLRIPFNLYHLTAKYDLLNTLPDGSAVIYDWKTNRRLPNREWMLGRAQSIIYPFLLVETGGSIASGIDSEPSKIKMIYWFTEFPDKPIEFSYDLRQYDLSRKKLEAIIEQINRYGINDFPKTEEIRKCLFCKYRSYCSRGDRAGSMNENDLDFFVGDKENPLDIDQIKEIPW